MGNCYRNCWTPRLQWDPHVHAFVTHIKMFAKTRCQEYSGVFLLLPIICQKKVINFNQPTHITEPANFIRQFKALSPSNKSDCLLVFCADYFWGTYFMWVLLYAQTQNKLHRSEIFIYKLNGEDVKMWKKTLSLGKCAIRITIRVKYGLNCQS